MRLTRRRFLAITAAALATGAQGAPVIRHSFYALGAECAVTLPGDAATARRAVAAVRVEAERVEAAFSLWRADSELSRLNRHGSLPRPSLLFQTGAGLAERISGLSGGAFDVTVQSLWEAYATGADPAEAPVGWSALRVRPQAARFIKPRMAATFNGLAQGLATDRAVAVLRRLGYRDVLANLGEFRGAGRRADGGPWRLGVADPWTGAVRATMTLDAGSAVATSEPGATRIGGQPHIFDPLGHQAPAWASVTVRARTAALADALSTAVAAAPMAMVEEILSAGDALEAVLIAPDGALTHLGSAGAATPPPDPGRGG